MKKVFLIYGVLIAAILVVYFGFISGGKRHFEKSKAKALEVSQHSKEFNEAVDKLMTAYYSMTEAFVNWDSVSVNNYANELKLAIDSLKLDDLKKDTAIYETAFATWDGIRNEIQGMISDATLEEKRQSLNLLSNQLYDLLRIIHYDTEKVYLQECPMAFNDEVPGNWLSKTQEVRNPYLGTKHPKYHSGMLNCGGPKDTLNFLPADANK
ncbi:MAG: hypothetical protein C4308_03030 [Chitinophagaceae bacterium]